MCMGTFDLEFTLRHTLIFKKFQNIIKKFAKKIANSQKIFTLVFFILGPLQLRKVPTLKDGRPFILFPCYVSREIKILEVRVTPL